MAELYIFSPKDELLTAITKEKGLISATLREELNKVPDQPFTFTVLADEADARYIMEENQVVVKDKENELRLFAIKEIEDVRMEEGTETTAICEPAYMELKEHIVTDKRFNDQTADVALKAALEGTRWTGSVGIELGKRSTNFYYVTAIDAVWDILNVWGGEFRDAVTFDGNRITSRKIYIVPRRGVDNGKRLEVDYNIEEIERRVLSYPVTSLYGRGASLETEGGGDTRYIDFAGVEWKKSKGDPTDKPKGQRWVGDPTLLQKYGRNHNGKLLHRAAIWQDGDIEDAKELLKATWEQLQATKQVEVNYLLSVHLLESLAGYDHERVSLGDTARVIDRNFSRPIEVQTRVIALEYDLLDIDNTAIVEMGQFLSLHSFDDRLDKIANEIDSKRRLWDTKDGAIDASKYPNIIPDVPIVTTEGLFAAIKIDWDYDYLATYVAGYEVYISEVKGFIPSPETLVWRGYGNSYSYHGEVNKQYYVRVRAFNYHDRYSDFSDESTALTQRIISREILFGKEHAETLQKLSKTAKLLADETIDFDTITKDAREKINEQARQYTDEEIHGKAKEIEAKLSETIGVEVLEKAEEKLKQELAGVDGKVTTVKNEIDKEKDRVSQAIEQLSNVDESLSRTTTTLTQHAEAIEARAKKEELNKVTGEVSSVKSQVKVVAEGLKTKAEATNVYTKKETDNKLGSHVEKTIYEKRQTTLDATIAGIHGVVNKTTTVVDDLTGEVSKVKSNVSTLEQTAKGIHTKVDQVKKENTEAIKAVQSTLDQTANAIALRATKTEVNTLTNRLSQAESQLTVQANEIAAKVEKDGLISAINMQPERIRIKSELIEIDGKTLIREGAIGKAAIGKGEITDAHIENVIIKTGQIRDGAITNAKIGRLAVDTANIANGAITDLQVSNINASKITSGYIDAANIAIMAMGSNSSTRQVLKMDKEGLHSYDSNGKLRILLAVKNYKGGSPAVLRFFDEKERNMGYIGANAEETFSIYSAGASHFLTDRIASHHADKFHFSVHRDKSKNKKFWVMYSHKSSSGDLNPSLYPSQHAYGYLGVSGEWIWGSYIVHMNYKNLHKDSSRDKKENIQGVDIDYYSSVFDQLNFVTYHYKNDAEEENPATFVRKNLGLIYEESPKEIKISDENKGIAMDDLTALIGIKVQQQNAKIKMLQEELIELKRSVRNG